MAEITASMVMALRAKTDAPMMDCKKALTEADGDNLRAEELLRVRFGNKASKASSRVAAEGAVIASISNDGKTGVLLEVNSETDFCAKNDEFKSFVSDLALAILENKPSNIDALSKVKINGVLQSYDQPLVVINDRTLVPLRGIFEALGANSSMNN